MIFLAKNNTILIANNNFSENTIDNGGIFFYPYFTSIEGVVFA